MSINNVSISGNLTRDIEVRTTSSGMAIGSLSVAVNERRKQGDEWVDYPNYIDCKLFGRRCDSLAQYLTKGTKVAITGKLHQSRWEKDGQKRSRIEVNIDDIDLCGSPRKREEDISDYSAPDFEPDTSVYDEDIPF